MGQELVSLFLWYGGCVEDVCMLQQKLASPLQAIFLIAVLCVFCLFSNLTKLILLNSSFLLT